jgi:hypothetical protein
VIFQVEDGNLPYGLEWAIVKSLQHFRSLFSTDLLQTDFKLKFEYQKELDKNLPMIAQQADNIKSTPGNEENKEVVRKVKVRGKLKATRLDKKPGFTLQKHIDQLYVNELATENEFSVIEQVRRELQACLEHL